jgi:hypothetical protein
MNRELARLVSRSRPPENRRLESQKASRQAKTAGVGTEALFAGREAVVRETYERLATSVGRFGPVTAEAKKTSIHLVAGTDGSAFAGVHPRKPRCSSPSEAPHP